jgi:glycosyltransferase involved in cell wall biosynthesis
MQPCALVVTDRELMPIVSGNRVRILATMSALRALGWSVTLVGIPTVEHSEALRSYVDGFVPVRGRAFAGGKITEFNAQPFCSAVRQASRTFRPSLIIAEYVWLATALTAAPSFIHRIVDCHDIFHERGERFRPFGLHPWVICTREQELERLAMSDVVIAAQNRDAAALKAMLPSKRIVSILTPIDLPEAFQPQAAAGNSVLTIGGNQPGNDAVLEFASEVWPLVVARIPDARLNVLGRIAERLPDLPNVNKVGHVEQLAKYYQSASVVLCPVTVGTGVKTKMLEALRFGKATVVTEPANEGMPLSDRRAWVTVGTVRECGPAIIALLLNAKMRADLESTAFEFGRIHLGQDSFRTQLKRLLPGAFSRTVNRLCR